VRQHESWGGGRFYGGPPPWAPYAWQDPDRRSRWAIVPPLAFIQVVGTHFASDNQPDARMLDLYGYALLVLGPLLLAWRTRHPVAVLAGVFAVTVLYLGLEYPYGPVFLSYAVALFAVVVRGHRRVAAGIAVASGVVAVFLDPVLGRGSAPPLSELAGVAAWTLVVFAAAEFARAQRGRFREMLRTREEEERRIASEERLRIARELHDVLAHNISLINVQAGVALHLMDEQPEQARTALTTIKAASKQTLAEMRSVLGVLRDVDETAPRSPTSGLAALPVLVETMSAAGLQVMVTTNGHVRPLPAGVDLAAYRIVQEALTNVRRHADAQAVAVTLNYDEEELQVTVENPGPAGRPAERGEEGGGHGIPGMRERAEALGGSLAAGPTPDGGFRVHARLPLSTGAVA